MRIPRTAYQSVGVVVIDMQRGGLDDRPVVFLVFPGQPTPAIIDVFHPVGDGSAPGVRVAGDGADAAHVVVAGADPLDVVVNPRIGVGQIDHIGDEPARGVVLVGIDHTPLISGFRCAAEPVVDGRYVVALCR
jgi:hypothetical protein